MALPKPDAAAWVDRSRVRRRRHDRQSEPPATVEPDDQVADVVSLPAPAPVEELVVTTADYVPDRHPARTYLGRLAPSGRRSQTTALHRIAGFLSGGRLDADQLPWHLVRYQHVQRVRAWLADEAGLSVATGNAYLAALRGVVTECWRLGYIGAEDRTRALDVKRITGETLPRGRALTRGEMAAVFERLDATDSVTARRDAAIIAVMYSSGGVRRTELVRLDLADLDREACELRIRSGKGRKDRLVHLGPEACAALADWLDVRGLEPGALFLPVAKDRRTLRHDGRLDPTTVRLACQRRSVGAGVATFSPHDLRRTSISDLLDLTGDPAVVSRLAGHANLNTTLRYDRRPVEAERLAARSLHVPYRSRRVAR